MLQIQNLRYRIGGRVLFDGASVSVAAGQKAGLVGRNGAGKSTLLRLIAGALQPESGDVAVHGRARVGSLAQEAPDGPRSLIDFVLAADHERDQLLEEADKAADPIRIAEIHHRLADIQAHVAPARAATILAGLGFDEAAQQRPLSDYSGGWRMRVALAATLFARPDLLLLDEPSNHLDLEARIWLEGYLAAYPGTMLLVSHDRELLNAATNRTIHLDHHGRLTAYGGNFDRFERTLRERRALAEAEHKKQEAARRHMQAFVDRFRYKASKARQAQSRLKMLERLQPLTPVTGDTAPRFDFPEPEGLPPPLITLDGTSVGYDGQAVLTGLDLRIDMDDRIALLGANGNGKSTLLRLLARRLEPIGGRVHRSAKLRVGYFAQQQLEILDARETPFAHMSRLMPTAPPAKVRAHLGRFGFVRDKADVAVADLSGGEKAKLCFALLTRDAPHLLLLDEPTNHLDIDAREALVGALNDYSGAVLLVSHDPHLLSLTADRLWLVAEGTCRPYDGDLAAYRKLVIEARRAERRDSGQKPSNRKQQRRAAAANRQALAPLRQAARQAERDLEALNAQRVLLAERLADPETYREAAASVADLQRTLGQLDKSIAEAEAAWLNAQEALEAAR